MQRGNLVWTCWMKVGWKSKRNQMKVGDVSDETFLETRIGVFQNMFGFENGEIFHLF